MSKSRRTVGISSKASVAKPHKEKKSNDKQKERESVVKREKLADVTSESLPLPEVRIENVELDPDADPWACGVCDQTFKRKKHSLLHVRVAHKLSGEDVEKVVQDRFAQQRQISHAK